MPHVNALEAVARVRLLLAMFDAFSSGRDP